MTETVFPSHAIPLDTDSLVALGELTAIVALIDKHMVEAIAHILGLSTTVAAGVLGSNNFTINAQLWADIVTQKTVNPHLGKHCGALVRRARALGARRNSFVHAVFVERYDIPLEEQTELRTGQRITSWSIIQGPGPSMSVGNPTSAINLRKPAKPGIAELQTARDEAAVLSCEFAHVTVVLKTADHDLDAPSPWREIVRPGRDP